MSSEHLETALYDVLSNIEKIWYFGQIADSEFDVPGHPWEKVDLEDQKLLDKVQILFVFLRQLHLGVCSIELQDES